ncbi:hypothetical protein [Haliscomenobacter sp.]|uniref:hypothetical protein n=1 Tax=Haliscomenobacter sp. TaxID=2717303 RepID=UPI003BAA6565
MQDLIELIQVVSHEKLEAIRRNKGWSNKKSKLMEFYNKIADGDFPDDDTAARELYNADKQAPAYKKLRKTLKDELISALFLIDLKQPSFTDRQLAYYGCHKEWAAAKILFAKNARHVAVGIATKLLKFARKYEFTELIIDICHLLRIYHGTNDGNIQRFQQYNLELKNAQKNAGIESRAIELYLELSIHSIHSKASKETFLEQAKAYFEELKPALQQNSSYLLHLYGRLLEAYIFACVNDHAQVIEVAQRAIAFFKTKDYTASVPLLAFHYQIAVSACQQNNLPLAQESLQQCFLYAQEESYNWYKLQELLCIVNMHQHQPFQVFNQWKNIRNSFNYEHLPAHLQEFWRIVEAYLVLLGRLNQLPDQLITKNEHLAHFKIGRFVNDVPLSSKDKKGLNIHVLILEMMFNLVNLDFDHLSNRIDAINKYRNRYLQSSDLQRSDCFFRFLLSLPKIIFDRTALLRKQRETIAKLSLMPHAYSTQSAEMEIVPYETLAVHLIHTLSHASSN